jgi:hypothetical protein
LCHTHHGIFLLPIPVRSQTHLWDTPAGGRPGANGCPSGFNWIPFGGTKDDTDRLDWRLMESFEIIGEITAIEAIAVGRGIRELVRLRRQYGSARWRKLRAWH